MKNYTNNILINKINQLLRKCTICKNYNTRGGNFISVDSDIVDIIFVAQNPGASSYNKNIDPENIIPFGLDTNNPYNQFFRFFISAFNKKFKRDPMFYITNIIKCVTKDNKLEDIEMINSCVNKYLVAELKYLVDKNNKIKIVTLGSVSKRVFNETSILQRYKTINIFHPGYMNRKGSSFVESQANVLVDSIKSIYIKSITLF